MKKRRLGLSDLYVSEIGLGTMSFRSKSDTERLIHYAIDHGVNFIDTADLYRYGEIETWIGQALKGIRDQVILATKVGNHWEKGKEGWFWDPSKKYIQRAVKDSLTRLKTDYIDLYQLHGGTIDDPIDETIEAFEELKKEGIIRYYGISSIRPNVIKEYVKRSKMVSVMMPYSLLDRRPEEEMLSLLHDHHISVIARGPLAQGMLTERAEEKIPEDGMLQYRPDEIRDLLSTLRSVKNRSLTEIALRFPLSHPEVATVIPGASTFEQLKQNIAVKDSASLSDEELQQLKQWTKENMYESHR